MKLNKYFASKFKLFFAVTLYIVLLNYAYIYIINDIYSYAGMTYNRVDGLLLLTSYLFGVLPLFIDSLNFKKPSQYFFWSLYLIVFIPALFIPYYVNKVNDISVFILSFVLLVNMLIIGCIHRVPNISLNRIVFSKKLFFLLLSIIMSTCYIFVLYYFWNILELVNLKDVYVARETYKEASSSVFINYMLFSLAFCFNPFLIVYGLIKNWYVFAIGILGQVLLYSVGAHKSIILSILLILFLWYFLNRKKVKLSKLLVYSSIIISGITIFLYTIFDVKVIPLISLYNRTFITPSLLTSFYHDFFSENAVTLFSDVSGISALIDNPYDKPISKIIGDIYFPYETNSNANIWAHGLSGGYYIGVFVITIFTSFILWILDCFSKTFKNSFIVLLVSYQAINITNISIFTSLLSNGFFLTILLIFLMPRHLLYEK